MAKNLQLVVFNIGRETYGIGIDRVYEIIKVPDIASMPDAPDFFEGVINLRGKIIPIIDLRKRLRAAEALKNKNARILITENSGFLTGLLVDSVTEVLKLPPEIVEDPPPMVSAIGIEYIVGVARTENGLIVLLDISKVLDVEDMKKADELVRAETAQAA